MTSRVRAFVARELSDDLSACEIGEIELAPPAAGELQIEVKATAIGFPDLLMSRGGYQFKPEVPFVPGHEGAGVITAMGEGVAGFAPGDRVIAAARIGLLAERANVPAASTRALPDNMSFEDGAGLVSAYLTAYVALARRGRLEPGETLLVHGAAGGVGLAAVEVGKLLGATVIATASTAEKRALALTKGADHAIDSAPGFRSVVNDLTKDLTDGQGADVIFDPVGGDVCDESLRCIAWGGRLLIIGFASGRISQIPANYPLIKGFSVVGVRGGEYGIRDPEKGAENIAQVLEWAGAGKIKPHIGARFALSHAKDALELMAARGALGRIIVAPG